MPPRAAIWASSCAGRPASRCCQKAFPHRHPAASRRIPPCRLAVPTGRPGLGAPDTRNKLRLPGAYARCSQMLELHDISSAASIVLRDFANSGRSAINTFNRRLRRPMSAASSVCLFIRTDECYSTCGRPIQSAAGQAFVRTVHPRPGSCGSCSQPQHFLRLRFLSFPFCSALSIVPFFPASAHNAGTT